jgi:hypothetical protein
VSGATRTQALPAPSQGLRERMPSADGGRRMPHDVSLDGESNDDGSIDHVAVIETGGSK